MHGSMPSNTSWSSEQLSGYEEHAIREGRHGQQSSTNLADGTVIPAPRAQGGKKANHMQKPEK